MLLAKPPPKSAIDWITEGDKLRKRAGKLPEDAPPSEAARMYESAVVAYNRAVELGGSGDAMAFYGKVGPGGASVWSLCNHSMGAYLPV